MGYRLTALIADFSSLACSLCRDLSSLGVDLDSLCLTERQMGAQKSENTQYHIAIRIPPLAQTTCPVHHAASWEHNIPTIPATSPG
jgi:hypothetical protein